MSELVNFAKAELRAAGLFDPDADYDGAIAGTVVSLMETFSAYGHSGVSAEHTLDVFDKLARHIPLTPLTGEDDEWEEHEVSLKAAPLWRNRRCPTILKNEDRAWDTAKGGSYSSGAHGRVTFPYAVE
jgi:hypothetical protein